MESSVANYSVANYDDEARGRSTAPSDLSSTGGSSLPRAEHVHYLACNLSSREESDLRPRTQLPTTDEFWLLSLGGRSIWFYCVLMALALAAVEWWLYQRRIVGKCSE